MLTIMALLLLRGKGGVIKAGCFAAGLMTVRLLQGLLFGYIFASAERAGGEEGPNLIASTIQMVVGIFLLISAVTTWRMEDDPDSPPPKWMTAIERMPAPVAFLIGIGLMLFAMKQWLFTFSAIAVIENANFGRHVSLLAYLFFVVGAQSLMLTPIIVSAIGTTKSEKMVGALHGWLQRHYLKIAIVASLIFGAWFFWKGASGLLALGTTTTTSES